MGCADDLLAAPTREESMPQLVLYTFAVPPWYGKGRTVESTALAATLSLWTGLGPAFDAIYSGLHREALNRRHDWFERTSTTAAPRRTPSPSATRSPRTELRSVSKT